MSVKLAQECAEAINSALFQSDFTHLGNTEGGRIEWWHRGDRSTPKQLRVSVAPMVAMPYVMVLCEWLTPGDVLGKGTCNYTVPCDGSQTRDKAIDASTEVVVKVLELFKSIIEGNPPMPAPEVVEVKA